MCAWCMHYLAVGPPANLGVLWSVSHAGLFCTSLAEEIQTQSRVREAVEMYLTWETFEKAVGRAVAGKAVGMDGFSTYALKRASRGVRVACCAGRRSGRQ